MRVRTRLRRGSPDRKRAKSRLGVGSSRGTRRAYFLCLGGEYGPGKVGSFSGNLFSALGWSPRDVVGVVDWSLVDALYSSEPVERAAECHFAGKSGRSRGSPGGVDSGREAAPIDSGTGQVISGIPA